MAVVCRDYPWVGEKGVRGRSKRKNGGAVDWGNPRPLPGVERVSYRKEKGGAGTNRGGEERKYGAEMKTRLNNLELTKKKNGRGFQETALGGK